MEATKLYSGPLSVFGAKAEIALREKGIPFELIMVGFDRITHYEPKHPEVLRINPKGQVPVLVDGTVEIFDSTQIFEYLEHRWPAPPLWPAEVAARAAARLLELKSDEVLFPLVGGLWRFVGKVDHPEQAAALAAIERCFARSEPAAGRPRVPRRRLFLRRHRPLHDAVLCRFVGGAPGFRPAARSGMAQRMLDRAAVRLVSTATARNLARYRIPAPIFFEKQCALTPNGTRNEEAAMSSDSAQRERRRALLRANYEVENRNDLDAIMTTFSNAPEMLYNRNRSPIMTASAKRTPTWDSRRRERLPDCAPPRPRAPDRR